MGYNVYLNKSKIFQHPAGNSVAAAGACIIINMRFSQPAQIVTFYHKYKAVCQLWTSSALIEHIATHPILCILYE